MQPIPEDMTVLEFIAYRFNTDVTCNYIVLRDVPSSQLTEVMNSEYYIKSNNGMVMVGRPLS